MTDPPENMSENGRSDDAHCPSEDEGLDPLKMRFVELLLEGESMEEAAKKLGRAPRTLRRWKNEPAVRTTLRERMAEAMFSARVLLTSGAVWAASTLVAMACGQEPANSARVASCNAILDAALRLAVTEDLAERIDELEKRLATEPASN